MTRTWAVWWASRSKSLNSIQTIDSIAVIARVTNRDASFTNEAIETLGHLFDRSSQTYSNSTARRNDSRVLGTSRDGTQLDRIVVIMQIRRRQEG